MLQLRYESGEDSLSPLLEADRERIDVEFERAEARAVLLTANVRLIRAMGGPPNDADGDPVPPPARRPPDK